MPAGGSPAYGGNRPCGRRQPVVSGGVVWNRSGRLEIDERQHRRRSPAGGSPNGTDTAAASAQVHNASARLTACRAPGLDDERERRSRLLVATEAALRETLADGHIACALDETQQCGRGALARRRSSPVLVNAGRTNALLLARSRTLSRRMASYAFLASYVQCGSADGATRPDPARRQHLGGLARGARRGVGSAQRETPHLE
jgi:hypothetical protein